MSTPTQPTPTQPTPPATFPTAPPPPSYSTNLTAAALLLLALTLRLANLTRLDIWLDEAHTFLTATSSRGILQALHSDTNPPLYFALMKPWLALAGISPFALRLPSVLAGTATAACLALFLREAGASRRTALFALTLAALAPLQIHYSQEARAYTLACLLLTIALYTYTRAVNRGGTLNWLAHAAAVTAGIYTHNLFLPIAAAFPLAAATAHLSRPQWRALTLTYALIALAALPGLALLHSQLTTSGGTAWIKPYWDATPPILTIPRSLEVLALGGQMPGYIPWPSLTPALRYLAIALTTLLALTALCPKLWCGRPARSLVGVPPAPPDRNSSATQAVTTFSDAASRRSTVPPPAGFPDPTPSPPHLVTLSTVPAPAGLPELGPHRYLPLIFTLWPLLFLFAYSLLRTPIYLVGRYDILAQPAYLALLALGLSRLFASPSHSNATTTPPPSTSFRIPHSAFRISSSFAAATLIAAAALALPLISLYQRWNLPLTEPLQRHSLRADYLKMALRPGDLILCTGLEASATLYQCQLRGIPNPILTFPRETAQHPGWFLSPEALQSRAAEWPKDAAAILDQAAAQPTPRLWIVQDFATWAPPNLPTSPADLARQELNQLLLTTATSRGWKPAPADPTTRATQSALHLLPLDHP